jgi:2-amino-4-hydroxy-6-hydroxymethyldihydropteridine diphosphokinase
LEPEKAIEALRNVERETGRKQREKWRKREIDIDILFYGNRIINKKGLKAPHPRLLNRNFVLKPLAELAPGLIHPVTNKSLLYHYNHTTDKNKVYLYSEKF